MLIKLTARNFKRFGEVEIEVGNPVVFIGPRQVEHNLRHAGSGSLKYRVKAQERETAREKLRLLNRTGVTIKRCGNAGLFQVLECGSASARTLCTRVVQSA